MTSVAADPRLAGRPADSFGFRNILYTKGERRATITINRPGVLNCLNLPTLLEMRQAFEDASMDDEVAVVVLTGAGETAFCTGADVKEQTSFLARPQDYWKWMGAFTAALEQLRRVGKPSVARLNGLVVGGGNEFNMACDLAVMVEDGYIRHVGPARGSVPAAGATQWLPIIMGDRRAREMLMLCEEVPALQALDWGLVNRVVPRARLDAAVDELVGKLVNKLPECTRYTKQQVDFWKDFSYYQTIGHARDWLTLHAGVHETAEGLGAFVEKRHVDYAMLRDRVAGGHGAELPDGPAFASCASCGATDLPVGHRFCGHCGATMSGGDA
ncbi:MAG: enoyl-CoA hydratase-related protein [Candidatus Sericytochromatia bacterium]|nr:enoyl-CoA hydratase-related protein [Candidatus Sericytochromatia bacterium]